MQLHLNYPLTPWREDTGQYWLNCDFIIEMGEGRPVHRIPGKGWRVLVRLAILCAPKEVSDSLWFSLSCCGK